MRRIKWNLQIIIFSLWIIALFPLTANASSEVVKQNNLSKNAVSLPWKTKPAGIKHKFEYDRKVTINWKGRNALGYEYKLRNKSGKVIKKGTTRRAELTLLLPNNKQVYTLQIRGLWEAYVKTSGGKTYVYVYGPWSDKYYIVPPPSLREYKINENGTLSLKWQPIKGVTQIKIYMTDKNYDIDKKYKKVATLKGNKTSVTLSKLNGKSFRYGPKYGIHLIATKKVKGKTYSSSAITDPAGKTTIREIVFEGYLNPNSNGNWTVTPIVAGH